MRVASWGKKFCIRREKSAAHPGDFGLRRVSPTALQVLDHHKDDIDVVRLKYLQPSSPVVTKLEALVNCKIGAGNQVRLKWSRWSAT